MHQRNIRSRRGRRLRPAILCLALAVGACASDEERADTTTQGSAVAGGSTTETTTSDPAAALGEANAATGEPLSIGFVFEGDTGSVDTTVEGEAAVAAAEYVNEYLGGVAGRPIELELCEIGGTPAGAADCVTQMATAGVPIVLNGTTGQSVSLFPPLVAAGIPVFTPGTLDRESLSTPGIYIMGNGLLTLIAGPAQLAADAGISRGAIAVIDVPAASGPLEAAAPVFYGNVGVEVDVVTIPADTPDMTPQITAELANNPGQFQVIGDSNFCGKVMRALESAGFDGQVVVIQPCLDEGAEVPNLGGAKLLSLTSTDPESPEVQLYTAVMQTYAPDTDRVNATFAGYQAVVGFARAVAGLEGEVSADSIRAALDSMPPTPVPLADGITFQCNRTAVAVAPNICSSDVLQTTLDEDGNATTFTVLDGTDVLTLGG